MCMFVYMYIVYICCVIGIFMNVSITYMDVDIVKYSSSF